MSLLSNTQGSPERVWSALAGLAVYGEQSRHELEAALNPGSLKPDAGIVKIENVRQVIGAASSLGAVSGDRSATYTEVDATTLSNVVSVADWMHDTLISLPSDSKDAVVLEAYAWLAARSSQSGSSNWIYELSADGFADAAAAGLVGDDDDGGKKMNSSKVVAWRRWLVFLGLAVPMPSGWPAQMSPTSRIARELGRANLRGTTLSADAFLESLAQRMPYLDRGALFLQASRRLGWPTRDRLLSPMLSASLRELHDEGYIKLQVSGDSRDVLTLASDVPHLVTGFDRVVISEARGS